MKSDLEFPRVLLVSPNVFNPFSGGGLTLTNLFRGWPRDRIATLHSERLPLENSICDRNFELGTDAIRLTMPFTESVRSWLRRRAATGDRGIGNRMGTARYLRWIRTVVGDGFPESVRLPPALVEWVTSFSPQVLYTLLGSLTYIRLVSLLRTRFKIPVVIHMMDDWPEHLHRRGVFGPWLRRQMLREFEALVKSAEVRLGICDEMCEEYASRYGVSFMAFHNTIEEAKWTHSAKKECVATTPFHIVYYGTIVEVAQLHSLMDVGWATAGLRSAGLNVEFWVHTQHYSLQQYGSVLRSCPGITIGPKIIKDDFISVITKADLLVLPVNFDEQSIRYLRLSFPTKLPAYMASGTPILAYGPPEMAQIRYLTGAGSAHVVTQRSREALASAIQRLMADLDYRTQIGRRAQMLALERHDAAKVRPAFQTVLARAAAGRSTGENLNAP